MSKILCIAEKLSLAEAAGNVLAEQKGVKPEFTWEDAKKHQYNQVGEVKFFWLDGHAFEQAEPDHYLPADVPKTDKGKKRWRVQDLPIIPQAWTIQPKEQKARRLAMVADELKRCEQVWHMGDPDEEGQVLIDECLQFYGYKGPVKRVLINDYNTSKVKEALANIRDNNEPMFRAWYMWGLARSRYDWLLGMNGTRAMTLRGQALGFDGLLPVGSVQTPLLYLVRERDRLIENFKPIPYYTLSAKLDHAAGSFLAKWKARDDQPGLDSEGRLISQAETEKLIARLTGAAGKIASYSKTTKQQNAPVTLSMNELQIEGFRKFGYSGKQVLDAGQTLYETYKVMSYPRSDNRYLSEVKHADAPAVLAAVFVVRPDLAGLASVLDTSRKSSAFNDKKMEGKPHHGIIPLVHEIPVDPSRWSQIERDIYELVARSYLAQFAAPYEYLQTSIEADIDGETFAASGRTPVAEGWKAIYAEAEEEVDDEPDDDKQTLPVMAKDDPAKCDKCESKSRNTKAPARFDDAMLTECMMNLHKYVTDPTAKLRLKEGDGIGTTATRGPMVDHMKERELFIPAVPAKKGSGKIMTSAAARALIDALPHEVKDPATAGVFKSNLDAVAKASDPHAAYKKFEAETVAWIARIVEDSKTVEMTLPASTKPKAASAAPVDTTYPCTCGNGYMQARSGQHGPFWSCSARPECDITLPDAKGKPGVRVSHSTVEHKCPECGKPLRQLTAKNGPNAGNKFWGCTGYAEGCKYSADDKDGKPVAKAKPAAAAPGAVHACPKCGKAMRLVPAKGNRKPFWSCTGYPDCNSTADNKDGKPFFKTKDAASA